MNIPEAAIQAATDAIFEDDPRITEGDAYDLASSTLEAALPHIEAALRKQIAADIRATLSGPLQPRASLPESFIDVGMERAATIAEEGPLE